MAFRKGRCCDMLTSFLSNLFVRVVRLMGRYRLREGEDMLSRSRNENTSRLELEMWNLRKVCRFTEMEGYTQHGYASTVRNFVSEVGC
jgi:hypothetical protein